LLKIKLNGSHVDVSLFFNKQCSSILFRENAKALCFDALIEKEGYMYKSEDGRTPRRTTRPKNRKIANLGEQNAHASSARVRPLPRLGNYVVEQGCH
jgi:hypothetical protein